MTFSKRIVMMAMMVSAIGLVPLAVQAEGGKSHKDKDSIPIDSSKDPQSRLEDRGQPGINAGGQVTEPGKGEQTGRPGTIFGGSATLPPQDKSPGFQGAGEDKQKSKQAPTSGGPR